MGSSGSKPQQPAENNLNTPEIKQQTVQLIEQSTSNTDNTQTVVVTQSPVEAEQSSIQQLQQFNFGEYIELLKFWKSPEYIDAKRQFVQEILIPSVDFYERVPFEMTDFKNEHVLPMGTNQQRIMALGLICITALFFQTRSKTGLVGIRKTIRNTIFTYFGFGLFIAPEVYNPFLKFHKDEQ